MNYLYRREQYFKIEYPVRSISWFPGEGTSSCMAFVMQAVHFPLSENEATTNFLSQDEKLIEE